jgi:putative salt-induced outer membrane protein
MEETLNIEGGHRVMKRSLAIIGMIFVLGAAPILAQDTEQEEEAEPMWKGSLGLSWVATTGNTDTSSIGVDFALDRKPEPWGLSFVARGNRADDQGELTAENYLVSARGVRALAKRWEVFGGLAWAKDPFAGFDSQTVASAGGTYKAVESERHRLSFDMGLAYTWEDRVPPDEDVDFAGGVLGVAWEYKLGASSKLVERLALLPNFDDSDDWRLNSTTTIEAAINDWLALRFGYDIRHRNQPIGDSDSTDTTSTASVVFNF